MTFRIGYFSQQLYFYDELYFDQASSPLDPSAC